MTIALVTLALLLMVNTGLAWWITIKLLRYTEEAERRRDEERRSLLNRMEVGIAQYPVAAPDQRQPEEVALDLDDDELMTSRLAMSKEDLALLADRQAGQPVLSIPPAVMPPTYNGTL